MTIQKELKLKRDLLKDAINMTHAWTIGSDSCFAIEFTQTYGTSTPEQKASLISEAKGRAARKLKSCQMTIDRLTADITALEAKA